MSEIVINGVDDLMRKASVPFEGFADACGELAQSLRAICDSISRVWVQLRRNQLEGYLVAQGWPKLLARWMAQYMPGWALLKIWPDWLTDV